MVAPAGEGAAMRKRSDQRAKRRCAGVVAALAVAIPTLAAAQPAGLFEPHPTALPHQAPPNVDPTPLAGMGSIACVNGKAGPFACHEIDLLSLISREEVTGGSGATLSDLWGWTDPETGREIALVGLSDGVAFVDVTAPATPAVLGWLPTQTVPAPWRDLKVHANRMYVVADGVGLHGMQIFDLTRLRSLPASGPVELAPDDVYYGAGFGLFGGELLGSAHNVAIDEETGFAYVVGSGSTCNGGLHVVDLEGERPLFAGCYGGDGYTHDVQCVVYRGPDAAYQGHEVCFAANEDTLTFVDVTDKTRPVQLARVGYEGFAYVHQAWLTEDHRFLLSDDESEELVYGHGPRTYVWDVQDLDAPHLIGVYTGPTTSSDHNLYVRGGYAFEANYRSGLHVVSLVDVEQGALSEVGYFDVDPSSDEPGFDGAWSVYPYFASGTVVVTGISQGLFVLRPHFADHVEPAADEPAVAP